MVDFDAVNNAFCRHVKIGFQFSGGRDSTAALYLLRDFWNQMTVYHLDTGDQFPETREVVRQVESDMGRPLHKIYGHVHDIRMAHGLPSDLVPVDNTFPGLKVSGLALPIQGRYECCYRSLMKPMQDRMLEDGITLIVRGQRDDEYASPPMRSGDVEGGQEVLYPIQHWTGQQVSDYLNAHDLPIAAFYARGMRRSPECMGCTAWWDEGRGEYLKQYHPQWFPVYENAMSVVREAVDRQYAFLKE